MIRNDVRAIDTNIIVRLAARDDPGQLETAARIVTEDFLVLPTVVLEAEWVLRSSYNMTRRQIIEELRDILGLETAKLVSGTALHAALAGFQAGADFGDALHAALALEAGADSFASFEKRIAKGLGNLKIEFETLT